MRILASVLLLAIAVPAVAQEQAIRNANLPRQLEWELLRMYEGHAERYDGPATIGRLEVVRGDVAVLGGPFRIAGRVMGDVVMVNGDVIIEEGGSVTGDITVIGGEVRLGDDADVRGTITAYATSSRRYADEGRWGDRDDRDDRWETRRSYRGFSRLTLRTGASYNRVEGLPLMFGPVLQTEGRNPLRLEALAIWRSESGTSLDTDRMGYQVRAEQFLFGHRRVSIGGSAYSTVDPMDRWQITDLEASLATALFHEDYRDHYGRKGWSGFATVEPVRGLEASVEYRQETHSAVAAGDPWSLFDRGELWRLQPIVGQGDIQLVTGSLELDLRDDDDDPERGWLARVSVDQPVGGTLTRPSLTFVRPEDGTATQLLAAEELGTDFTTGLIDVRRYTPVSRGSQINFRVAAGGALSEQALPPQFQHALGGLGTLPGFPVFSADCGARAVTGRYESTRFFTRYGCDRFVLGQVEYRGGLSLDFGFGEPDYDDDDWWGDIDIDLSPTWVVFFDAAQGWSYGDALAGTGTDTGILYDAGVGFLVDDLGFYVALPLNGDVEQEPRFFVRLGRRF